MRSELLFQTTPWLIIPCILAGIFCSWLLYRPDTPWSRQLGLLLAASRAILIALICFLLLAPLIRQVKSTIEKASVILAIDNSQSMARYGTVAIPQLKEFQEALSAAGYEVIIQTINNTRTTLDSVRFDARVTDLASLLSKVKSNFEGRNISDVVLLSDGIINQGASPLFGHYPFKVSTLAVGDTTAGQDIQLRGVSANRVAYLGNTFPIQADISAKGMKGRNSSISLLHRGKLVSTLPLIIDQNDFFRTVQFTTSSDQKGMQHYTIEIAAARNEVNPRNNRRDLYIDIIDGREKILLLALAPHPDVKSLRSIIEQNENYELDVRILTADPSNDYLTKPYDLVILHQLPDLTGAGGAFIQKLSQSNTPIFWIVGPQSNLPMVSTMNRTIRFNTAQNQFDKVTGRFNTGFQLFNLEQESMQLFDKLPPLSVPFSEFNALPGSEVILYQQVGTVPTTKPLLAINIAGDRKGGILTGEGLWRWRQEEFARTGKHQVIDNLLQKTTQILSVKDDKRKFRVYPAKPEFDSAEPVVFFTEIYNDIYEKTYGQRIALKLTHEKGKVLDYGYQNTLENPKFEITGLSEGVYKYKAATTLQGKQEEVSGEFIVSNIDIEGMSSMADFGLLRALASQTGGQFSTPKNFPSLINKIIESHPADRIDSMEEMAEIIYLKWIFFLLLLLASFEWGLRKYYGSY